MKVPLRVPQISPVLRKLKNEQFQKFKYYNMMIEELRKTLEEEIKPLLNN